MGVCVVLTPFSSRSRSQTGKAQIQFAEYMAIMEKVPLHADPSEEMKNCFSIFDQSVWGRG